MDNASFFFLIFGLSNQSKIIDELMIFGAIYLLYFTFLLMGFLVFGGSGRERKAFILAILSIPVAIVFIKAIHLFFYEPRPFIDYGFSPLINHKSDASFPSRHASIMSVVAFAYTYYKSRWALLFLGLLIFVGISRIYVGVHYPLDILGGVLVGVISLATTKQIVHLVKIFSK